MGMCDNSCLGTKKAKINTVQRGSLYLLDAFVELHPGHGHFRSEVHAVWQVQEFPLDAAEDGVEVGGIEGHILDGAAHGHKLVGVFGGIRQGATAVVVEVPQESGCQGAGEHRVLGQLVHVGPAVDGVEQPLGFQLAQGLAKRLLISTSICKSG